MKLFIRPIDAAGRSVNPRVTEVYVREQIAAVIGESATRKLSITAKGNTDYELYIVIEGPKELLRHVPNPVYYRGLKNEKWPMAQPLASHKSYKPYVVMALLLASVVLMIWVKESYKYPGSDRVNQAITEANNSAQYWEIRKVPLTLQTEIALNMKMQAGRLSQRCSEVPKATFMVGVKDQYANTAFLFNSEKYTMEIGGDYSKINYFDVCDVIDKRLDIRYPLLDILGQSTIGVSRGINLTVPLSLAVELIYMCLKVVRAYTSCIEVLVKGYADGQDGVWWHAQERRFFYPEVSIYPKMPGVGFDYKHSSITYHLPKDGTYTNRDLPNLRARFVQKELIENKLGSCKGLPHVTSHVLEGSEFQVKSPSDRKVQVFIVLF